jgi:hypothetical protein
MGAPAEVGGEASVFGEALAGAAGAEELEAEEEVEEGSLASLLVGVADEA